MIDTTTGTSTAHPVYPLADCPVCASLDRSGLDLTVHCSTLTGIVRQVTLAAQPVAGVYQAMGEFVSPLPMAGARPFLHPQAAFGRGATKEEALHGCIAEALERYSLIYRGTEPLVRARLGDMPAIDPRAILLYSDRQYARRQPSSVGQDERWRVPEPFDPDSPLEFLPGLDLSTGETVGVPAACCLMWYQFRPGERQFAHADTNGCAAGRTLADALASALLEWVERDAVAIWWYNRLRRPAVPADAFNSPPLLLIRDSFRELGRDLILLDVTTDLQIPAFVAIAPRHDGSEPIFAAAAHPSPRIAAWRAAAEAAQIYFAVAPYREEDTPTNWWLRQATLENQPYLRPAELVTAPPEGKLLDAGERVALCLDKLTAAGLRPICVDLSRPDVLLKTVRVVIPGIRHVWSRFAPGRLYDVPVRLGWISQPTREADLNSIDCMI